MANNRCVYTVITRGYDDLRQPNVVDNRYDYICFCNDKPIGREGVWDIRHFNTEGQDEVRSSRSPKMKPHELLPEYQYSLYIDANVCIKDHVIYDSIDKLIEMGCKIGQVDHIWRQDLYMEINYCIIKGIDRFWPLARTYWHIAKTGFPICAGLFENNIIFREHNDPIIKELGYKWWDMYRKYTKRDQCLLMYIHWQLGIKPFLLLPPHTNTRNSPHVTVIDHNKDKVVINNYTLWVYRKYRVLTALLHLFTRITGRHYLMYKNRYKPGTLLHRGFIMDYVKKS